MSRVGEAQDGEPEVHEPQGLCVVGARHQPQRPRGACEPSTGCRGGGRGGNVSEVHGGARAQARAARRTQLLCPLPAKLEARRSHLEKCGAQNLMLLSLSAFVRKLSVTVAAAVVDALYDRAVMIGGAQRRTTNEEQGGPQSRRPSTPKLGMLANTGS